MEIIFGILLCYIISIIFNLAIAFILKDSDWKYAEFKYIYLFGLHYYTYYLAI